jgi:transcriptional regulator with XRE-family HTH domain
VNDWRARLRLAVERSHRKQSAIAEEAGIAPETLSRILTSKHAHPQFETVVRIAEALRVPVGWVLDEPLRGRTQLAPEDAEVMRRMVEFLNRIEQAARR